MAESVTPNRAYAFPATSRLFVRRGEKDDRYEDLDKEGDRGEEDDRGEDLGKGEDRGEEDDRDEEDHRGEENDRGEESGQMETELSTETIFKEMSQTTRSDSVLQLDRLCLQLEKEFEDLAFVTGFSSKDRQPILTITQREMHHHPPFGHTSRIHLIIKDQEYVVNVLGVVIQSGSVSTDEEVHELCNMFSDQSSYKFCPGIEWDLYEEYYHKVICYHLRCVRYSIAPYQRVDSVNCARWYKLPSNAPLADKFAKEVMCPSCKYMKNRLNSRRKLTVSESPSKKIKRQLPSSKAKLSFMSPASQSKRKQNALTERNNDKRKLTKYEKTEITLAD